MLENKVIFNIKENILRKRDWYWIKKFLRNKRSWRHKKVIGIAVLKKLEYQENSNLIMDNLDEILIS